MSGNTPARRGLQLRLEPLHFELEQVAPAGEQAAHPRKDGACPVDAPKNNLRVEGYTPPGHVIKDVEHIMEAAGIDVGGVEYFVDDRDGRRYYYDINALSNFVADAPRVVGFDPFARLADYLEAEAARATTLTAIENAVVGNLAAEALGVRS